jgi:hypothetical protein
VQALVLLARLLSTTMVAVSSGGDLALDRETIPLESQPAPGIHATGARRQTGIAAASWGQMVPPYSA